jgi:hypothetical protein
MADTADLRFPFIQFNIDRLKSPFGHRPHKVNEFFLIEFLLRSSRIRALYSEENGKQKFQAILRQRGIHSQDPLSGSHHHLLIESEKFADEMGELGYLDVGLGILDLGKIFSLPPGYETNCDGMVLRGSFYGGEEECRSRLRMSDPLRNRRALSLYCELNHPPDVIWKRLRPILHARHEEATRQASGKEAMQVRHSSEQEIRDNQRPHFNIRNVRTWLEYLYCYDYSKFENKTYGDIGALVYGKKKSATDSAKKAVKRVGQKILYVEEKYVPDEFIENPPFGIMTRFKSRVSPS